MSSTLIKRTKDEDGNPVVHVAEWYWEEINSTSEALVKDLDDKDATIRELAEALRNLMTCGGSDYNINTYLQAREKAAKALKTHAKEIKEASNETETN